MTRTNTVDSIIRIKAMKPEGGLKSLPLKPRFKKSSYRKLASSFLIFAMLFQIIGGVFYAPNKNEVKADIASDWLTGWSYRTPVVIDNNNAETLTDYQTKITLQGTDSTASNYIDFDKVLSNGADLRITDSDKVTQIPYWIENWDDTAKTATVWTKVPNISASSTPPYYKFSTSQTNHDNYGLSYPVTYEFNIPANSSNLKAYKKYIQNGEWTEIGEKTSSDFFNGIEAVRVDYPNNKAYLSVAFDANSNDIYLEILDANNTQVGIYQKMDKYYDNRQAAVVATADDWGGTDNTAFKNTCDAFTSRHIWFTPGIMAKRASQSTWNDIQSKIDAGYVEPASHSSNHVATPYADYDIEIGGSKDDIINNLNLPTLNTKGNKEYLYAWLAPFGDSDDTARNKLGQYEYLVDRSTSVNQDTFVSWDPINGLYNRAGASIEADDRSLCSWAPVFPGTSMLNSKFDTVVATGGIYNLYFHPACVTTNELASHLDYIKDRTNVWYAGFGHLYLYNFTHERAVQRMAIPEQTGQNVYLYYGKTGVLSLSDYDNTFTKDYEESGLAGLWHMDEEIPGSELLTNGSLENWTNATTLANWTSDGASTGVREITQETTNKQDGASALKLLATGSDGTNFGVYQDIVTAAGQTYQVNFYSYLSCTAGTLKVEAWDNTNNVSLGSQSISTNKTAFSFTSFRFTSTNTASVRIKIYLNGETTSGTAYADALSVRQSSDTLLDSSGNNNIGTIYGASRTFTDGGQWGNRSDAIFSQGSALQFDGKDDYVDMGNRANLENQQFTISVLAGTDTPSASYNGAIAKGISNGYATEWEYQFTFSNGKANLHISDGTSINTKSASIGDNLWHLWTAVVSPTQLILYKDGISQGDPITRTVTINYANHRSLIIGGRTTGTLSFNGVMDEIRIYNRALSVEEIMSQYQRRKYSSLEVSSALFSPHTLSGLYKGTTNIISSANDYITYSSDPAIGNLVNSNMSFTPPTGSIDVILTDATASANYANSSFPGMIASNLDRETNFNHNGTTSLKINPSSGTVDINIDTWHTSTDYYKKWTESSTTHDLTTTHTIGDLQPNVRYTLKVDGQASDTYVANDQGQISFAYNGGYSTKTFELEETPSSSFIAPSKPSLTNVNITTDNGNLTFDNLPSTITQIAISTTPDFTDASWEDIAKKDELLTKYAGADKLYIKFRTQEGGVSDTIIKEGNTIDAGQDDTEDNNPDTDTSTQSL
ncbi:MAG: DUF2341 domain-containing protein, partial [Parabacteroides sp.]|nr:DUF2341 domain-containing protein [Parabacteroides sp.]